MEDVLRIRGLWIAVFALLGVILMDSIPNLNFGHYQQYVDTILLVLAAIFFIPVSKKIVKNTNCSNDK